MNPIRSWNRLFFAPISARPLGTMNTPSATSLLATVLLAIWPKEKSVPASS